MRSGKIKAILFIVVFLLVMATAITLLLDMEKERKEVESLGYDPYQATPAPTPLPTVTPMPVSTIMPTPMPTPTPAPTPTPTPAPTSTPVPTPPPFTAGQEIASGSFASSTGVPLNIHADWTATVLDADQVRVKVDVYLDSYSLQIIPSRNALNVSVGDSYVSADTPAVDLDDNTKINRSYLNTTEHTINLSAGETKTIPVQIQYLFRGTYFQRDIETIECGGPINLLR